MSKVPYCKRRYIENCRLPYCHGGNPRAHKRFLRTQGLNDLVHQAYNDGLYDGSFTSRKLNDNPYPAHSMVRRAAWEKGFHDAIKS